MNDTTESDYEARIVTAVSADEVYDALTTLEGLSAWWTPATGDATAGGEITFHFSETAKAVMRVDDAQRGIGVRWTTIACMVEDWVGTTQHFQIEALPGGGAEIRFRHEGLTPKLECYADCKNGWDHFIPSLRSYLDTGTGNPTGSPADLARREARANASAVGAA
ncbi:MAG TPA: SRPBCC domain-containing protein [Mycobacteriales bacterium]|nr:SRPBCC domain-containing protein [Mycobacteriales bacterium]